MSKYAVLLEGFEHLSYPLGRGRAASGTQFTEQKETYALRPAASEGAAKTALEAADFVAEHASQPVGFVSNEDGEVFVVCKSAGARQDASGLTRKERRAFSLAVMQRLASLHTQGLGCGGISPDAIEITAREARLINPCAIFALDESDSLYYEAIATLRALAGAGFAKKGELEALAQAYVSASPVCRHEISAHLQKKGISAPPASALASAAMKYLLYF